MNDQIKHIVSQLNANAVGIFPTDTIYGLTCLPTQSAIDRLFDIKQRQRNQPFLMLIPNLAFLVDWIEPLSSQQQQVLDRYWPGPYTFIFNKKAHVADYITAGKPTIAIRFPQFDPLIQLMTLLNQPVLSTSLNKSGEPSITSLDDLAFSIKDQVDFCFDGVKPSYGLESTLVDLTVSPFNIIRQGVGLFEID